MTNDQCRRAYWSLVLGHWSFEFGGGLTIDEIICRGTGDGGFFAAVAGLLDFGISLGRGGTGGIGFSLLVRRQKRLDLVALRQQVYEPGELLRRNRWQAGGLFDPLLGLAREGRIVVVLQQLLIVCFRCAVFGAIIIVFGIAPDFFGFLITHLG